MLLPMLLNTRRQSPITFAPSGTTNAFMPALLNPRRVNKTSTATVSTPAATTSLAPFTGEADNGVAPRQLVDMGQVYGLVLVVGGFLAGFATLL
ncbi:hypothetical protein EYZ11_012278 [Aspergillus tanneri]|uniref:Uncharacterized protein n=1 Tax=Aspergillus tanneri TaxID=1220188 RepID=A0A4V3UMR3_9EURO|nr:hypothetical protein EYZ11_012278 [Aspergillus tanneri]